MQSLAIVQCFILILFNFCCRAAGALLLPVLVGSKPYLQQGQRQDSLPAWQADSPALLLLNPAAGPGSVPPEANWVASQRQVSCLPTGVQPSRTAGCKAVKRTVETLIANVLVPFGLAASYRAAARTAELHVSQDRGPQMQRIKQGGPAYCMRIPPGACMRAAHPMQHRRPQTPTSSCATSGATCCLTGALARLQAHNKAP